MFSTAATARLARDPFAPKTARFIFGHIDAISTRYGYLWDGISRHIYDFYSICGYI
jgi:hypothetical protein